MCPPGSLNDQIAKNWKFVRSYTIKDGHLFLSLMADGGIYEFEPVGSSQASALGKRWTLTEINEAAVRTTKPYIEFDVNAKRFSGDGGCNRIAGSFEVDGMHIRFSPVISTRRACIDNKIQQVETDFLKRLEEVTEFQIQGEVLRLYTGDRPILTFRADSPETGSPKETRVTGTVSTLSRTR